MTTIAQRMRAAAELVDICGMCPCTDCTESRTCAQKLRADADALEAVERDLIEHARDPFGATALTAAKWADRIRGETK